MLSQFTPKSPIETNKLRPEPKSQLSKTNKLRAGPTLFAETHFAPQMQQFHSPSGGCQTCSRVEIGLIQNNVSTSNGL
jgi:hypothetical protein